ncbi:uncharacterized protein LOC117341455, partial [Pecten maximus]|uniref:uncharacterized protein LOC117341455 n=1 Tax=Pecten maximus TaxID=6579 RepID=UPI001457FC52
MASKTAERCKLWREKRKDDAEYWEQERIRKRNARRLRSAEKKEHDRELSRKRQTKFRERKKVVSKVNTTQLEVHEATGDSGNIEIIDNTGSTSISSDDVSSQSSFHVTDTVSKSFLDPDSKDSDSDESSDNMILEKDAMNDEDCHMILQNLNGHRLAVVNTPTLKNDQSRTEEEINEIKQRQDTRHAYFKALQIALSHNDDFDSMRNHCNSYAQHIDKTYPIGDLPVLDGENYKQDWVASSLYPCDDSPDNHVPIKTGGDGNCLPRIGSLFVFGNEKQHVEFRVRIFMELCRFEDTYLDNSFLNRGSETPLDDIVMALALYSDVYVPRGKDKCRFAFRQYVKSVLQTNSFSGMWSIFGLASVIGVPIFSIYPSYGGHNVRRHLHRKVIPRVFRQDNSRLIHIMWTNTVGNQQSPIAWTPNHFVAVLPTQDTIQSIRETALELATPTQKSGIQACTNETGSNMQKEFLPTPPTSTPTKFVEM